MPSPAKHPAPASAKRAAKQAAEPKAAPKPKSETKAPAKPDSKPFLRFHHSQALRVKTLKVLLAVEAAEQATEHADVLTDLVLELTDQGLDQYFLQSLKATKANFLVQQSAALGMVGVNKLMGTVIRNIISRMDDKQLRVVCGSIRQFMA
ncbi:hypothetical protein [Paucibacter sp. KCTC 42545]|uniref:hypothetical protein n=1 Tax=Paucibacter sp. KCTC 42545 TaxID=1768242 RepID=UPI000733C2DE|nr:hypothetical protein [Paucibacter sp. KCTC 42545]ALT76287.1 hypothetical protein AT984_02780 [Paucibacter sp. KCTC 42545]